MRTTFGAMAATALLSAAALTQASAQQMQWNTLELPATGVSLRVPLGIFEALSTDDEDAQGRLFVSRDGKAQLLFGAFENEDRRTVSEHRKHVIQSQYAKAVIDYAPVRRNWFVLSGMMDARTFYQRVTFTCGRRLISSWAMIYPTSEKRFYDRLVERMHRTFTAGRGPDDNCRLSSGTN